LKVSQAMSCSGVVSLFAWHEPRQVALAAAVRTVAVDRLVQLAFDVEGDAAAMAAAVIAHE
jgi:hypothetical protein